MTLSVEQARAAGICRYCEKTLWAVPYFRNRVGDGEYAHVACIPPETAPAPMTLSVEQARAAGVCRICREVIFDIPGAYTFAFGKEYAHTACLERERGSKVPNPFKVALAQFPGNGVSRMETNAWVVKTVRALDRDPRVAEVVSLTYCDTPIPMLRNRAVRDAKQAGCRYLLMVDSDMAPDCIPGARPFWDVAWEFLMGRRDRETETALRIVAEGPTRPGDPRFTASPENDRLLTGLREFPPATIAAPYCGPPPEECCYVFHWTDGESGGPEPGHRLEMIPRAWAAVKAGIEEVAALPTGLILYDLRVFDVLPPPWFRYEHDPLEAEKWTTEDVYQTRNASLLGLPQYVAWDCWAGHVKSKHVGRPVIVTRDRVHQSLAEAVRRGVDSGDRLVCLAPKEAP